MPWFKSFEPEKFSKAHRYIGRRPMGLLCCNCGYPYGQHNMINACPTRDMVDKGIKAVKHIKPL